jgi:hypothetical protein
VFRLGRGSALSLDGCYLVQVGTEREVRCTEEKCEKIELGDVH